jgi:predicted transcriptional regulator
LSKWSKKFVETKSARLTILIDPFKKQALEELCSAQDLTPSQVVRQLIRDYLETHGVHYETKSALSARGKHGR